MRRLIFVLSLTAIFSCSRKSEPVQEVAQDDINFAANSTVQSTNEDIQGLSDPGSGGLLYRRTNYMGGYFVYSYDTVINLKKIGCLNYTGDTLDNDYDNVYHNTTINFNCDRTDTIVRNTDTLIIRYLINGSLIHNDTADNNPLSFIVNVGSSNLPFTHLFVLKKKNSPDSTIFYSQEIDNLTSKPTSQSSLQIQISRKILKTEPNPSCSRNITLNKTLDINFSNAPNWHPGLPIEGSQTLKININGDDNLVACSGANVDITLSTPTPLTVGVCPNTQSQVGPLNGQIELKLTLPGNITQNKSISFSNCQPSISN
jgi:hypothetical protein